MGAREASVLEFARLRWRHQGLRDQALLEQLGLTPAQYALELARVLELSEAEAYDAQLVRRLRRLRSARRHARPSRAVGFRA